MFQAKVQYLHLSASGVSSCSWEDPARSRQHPSTAAGLLSLEGVVEMEAALALALAYAPRPSPAYFRQRRVYSMRSRASSSSGKQSLRMIWSSSKWPRLLFSVTDLPLTCASFTIRVAVDRVEGIFEMVKTGPLSLGGPCAMTKGSWCCNKLN